MGAAFVWLLRLLLAPWMRLAVELFRRSTAADDLAELLEGM